MSLNSKIRKIIKEEWLYNPREHPFSYSVFYSGMVKKYLFYKRGLWRMSERDVLLNKKGAEMVCSILNKSILN